MFLRRWVAVLDDGESYQREAEGIQDFLDSLALDGIGLNRVLALVQTGMREVSDAES